MEKDAKKNVKVGHSRLLNVPKIVIKNRFVNLFVEMGSLLNLRKLVMTDL